MKGNNNSEWIENTINEINNKLEYKLKFEYMRMKWIIILDYY